MTGLVLESQSEVIHILPGRLRLRVPLLENKAFTNRLVELLTAETWIKKFRINTWATSVVIHYHQRENQDIIPQLQEILAEAGQKPSSLSSSPKLQEEEWSSLTLPLVAVSLAVTSRQLGLPFLRVGAIASLIAATLPVAQRAVNNIFREQKLNIDCLDLLAIVFSGLQGRLITPALMITLHELGDLIRDRTARATERQTAELLDTIGRYAWVEREGKLIQINSDCVIPEEIVIVYPGEQIPVDGVVLKGEATIDQQQLTGESMPIVAQTGTYVYASTLLRSGQIHISTEKVGYQTRAAASWELLQKAPVHDTRMANYAAKLADKLIIPSLTWAGLVWVTTRDPSRVASILTLDFVTGIRVSIPTAFLGALNHITRHGILVRSGRTLELLSEIDTFVFDKTGTLTRGEVVVVGIQTVAGRLSEHDLLQLAASAEQRITHPLAEAIAVFAQDQGIEILPRENWEYSVGLGMTATIAGKTVLIGSERFLKQQDIDLEGFSYSGEELSLIYVACDGQFQGVIQYADPLRPESSALITKLQQDWGISVHLLTGDNQERAMQVAHALNIPKTQVYAEAFPEQKAQIVRDLHRSGRTVAFVGDGLNDSVALAYADVSISFAHGSEVARETADVVLMNNNLNSILEAIAIARETRNLIDQNILLVVGPNLLALGLASTVGLNPLLATTIHNGTAIAAGLNSLRPLAQHQIENYVK
ncbi:MAG: cadmium-translocating P-type ATPase [Gloeocapsa sp. DLM2.Bin57]|nr:MAG: cadmium-translocating P-type ATPase [Gloeocapsa sp. DLM2.Bin57]